MKTIQHILSAAKPASAVFGPVFRPIALFVTVAIMAPLVLTACSSTSSSTVRKASDVNLSGFSPEYRTAFDAGCERARAGGKVGDAPTFRNTPAQTVQGWRDGFDICRRK